MSARPRITAANVLIAFGHLLFAGLFVLAWIHFRERVIHVDSANQIFKWVQFDGVEVEVYRFSAVFPQLLVKLFRAFGADLRTLLLVASLGHVLVPYMIYVLTAHVWRVRWIAVGCALAAVLCTRLTFYGIVLEANYLLCYPFLLAAVLHGPLRRSAKPGNIVLAAFALFLTVAVHPVGFLLALYVFALFLALLPERRNVLVGLSIAALVWGLGARLLFPPSGYESGLYAAGIEGVAKAGEVEQLPSMDFLIGHTWRYTTHYLLTWLLQVAVITLLIARRMWAWLAIVLTGTVGYVALNVFTYHAGETAMMMEKNFVPLGTLIALPLVLLIERMPLRTQAWLVAPVVLVLFLQFRGISFAARPAHERLARIDAVINGMREAGIRKAAVPHEALDADGLHIHWALPTETLLASALDGPQACVSAVAVVPGEEATLPTGVFLGPIDRDLSPERLDARYFSMTGAPYVLFTPAPVR